MHALLVYVTISLPTRSKWCAVHKPTCTHTHTHTHTQEGSNTTSQLNQQLTYVEGAIDSFRKLPVIKIRLNICHLDITPKEGVSCDCGHMSKDTVI